MQLRSRTARGENLGQTGNISQPHMGSSVKLEIFFFFKAYSETNRKWKDSVDGDVCLPCKKSSLLFVSLFIYFFISKGGGFLLTCVNAPRSTGGSSSEENLAASFLFFFWQPNSGLSKFTLWGVWSILLFFASTIRIKISKCTPPPPP